MNGVRMIAHIRFEIINMSQESVHKEFILF